MSKIPRSFVLFLVAAAVVAVVSWLALPRLLPYRPYGAEIPAGEAQDFTLVGQGGQTIRLSDFRGKLVALYYGYTFCPDVCPTTLAELGQAMKQLGAQADEVQVILVTVDPERDTPDRLAEYVSYFDPSFIGLSGTLDQVAAAAKAFDIYYLKHEGTAASGYLVDHTASLRLLDREGRLRLIWPYGTSGDKIARDIKHLLR